MRAGGYAIIAALAWLAALTPAHAQAVCVRTDAARDNLTLDEQDGIRLLVAAALEREGYQPAPAERCGATGGVTVWAVRLGDGVTLTIAAGGDHRTGRAANLGEVDLLIAQLVRALITGRSLATGDGVTDRTNVLRDQAAPRRDDAWTRRWDRIVALGGGVLQLPAVDGRPRHRQRDLFVLEGRWWGWSGAASALELSGRIVLHDYAVVGDAADRFEASQDADDRRAESGRLLALVFSPLAIANYEVGVGLVRFAGARPPRPYLRLGANLALLNRFSDPTHYVDVGLGAFAGLGFQLTDTVGVSVAAHASNPVVHNWRADGYPYFFTATAVLEFRSEGRTPPRPRFLAPEPASEIRRIED